MNETHASNCMTYWSPTGDLEYPLAFDPKSNMNIGIVWPMCWLAKWEGNRFIHTHRVGGGTHADDIIVYTTWDGKLWQARWVDEGAKSSFLHTRNGVSHRDKIINYMAWDGRLWSATRKNETEFQHVLFGDAQVQRSFVDDIGGWIADNWREVAVWIIEYVNKDNDKDEQKDFLANLEPYESKNTKDGFVSGEVDFNAFDSGSTVSSDWKGTQVFQEK